MNLAAALIYWLIVALWLAVLGALCVAFWRSPRTFGPTRLLLSVIAVDTTRNLIENTYFGLYFGAQYGLFPGAIVGVLGQPHLLIIPKLINVAAACIVLGLLLLRWLPLASKEKANAESAARESAEALSQEMEEHRRLFETSVDLILVIDGQRTVTRISDSCRTLLGYDPSDIVGRYGGAFVSPPDLETLRREMDLSITGGIIRNFEAGFVHKDGYVVPFSLAGVWSPQARRFFLIGRDMTEQKEAEHALYDLAHVDQMTRLPNRNSLLRDLNRRLVVSDLTSAGASIALLDLDSFKDINDTLGHTIGDKLLVAVAGCLATDLGDDAQVYRVGGDGFCFFFPSLRDPMRLASLVEAELDKFERGFVIEGHTIFVNASAGIAIAPDHGATAEELMASADLALFEAKAGAGPRYRLFVPQMHAKAQARQKMEAELRRAAAVGEFVLQYQPQYRLSDQKLVGVEALLRWQHPTRGLLAPAAFIEALGNSSIAPQIGKWVLDNACRDAAAWRAHGFNDIRVGVNLFPAQFQGRLLLSSVHEALRASGLPANALELEITENIALSLDHRILDALKSLREDGVGLAFDDFGTGYASLSYLAKYPLTRLKIDRSFIQKITRESPQQDTAIVRSIITMAHSLGLEVIAEGVETMEQMTFLSSASCDEIQGFLYSKPLTNTEFEALLAKPGNATQAAGW